MIRQPRFGFRSNSTSRSPPLESPHRFASTSRSTGPKASTEPKVKGKHRSDSSSFSSSSKKNGSWILVSRVLSFNRSIVCFVAPLRRFRRLRSLIRLVERTNGNDHSTSLVPAVHVHPASHHTTPSALNNRQHKPNQTNPHTNPPAHQTKPNQTSPNRPFLISYTSTHT